MKHELDVATHHHRSRLGGAHYCCLALLAAALVGGSGCILNPAARADRNKLVKSAGDLQEAIFTTADQITRIASKISDLVAKAKAGEISASLLAEQLPLLQAEKAEALANKRRLEQSFMGVTASIKTLEDKHDVPRWQIILTILGTLASGSAGGLVLAHVKNAGVRTALTLARSGLQAMYGSVETADEDAKAANGGTATGAEVVKIIKNRMARVNNPEIQAIHSTKEQERAEAA